MHIVSKDLKFELTCSNHKHMLYKQIFVFHCSDCLIIFLTEYTNNSIFQELQKESEYFFSIEQRIYVDLKDSRDYTGEFK